MKAEPKAGKDTIYVDVDDEITSIIDKVENSSEKVVALVLPKRATSKAGSCAASSPRV